MFFAIPAKKGEAASLSFIGIPNSWLEIMAG